jgi:small subunit ribosomal protein S1
MLKQGDRVDAVILSIKPEERRIALGLKQTLADPWTRSAAQLPVGSQIEGPVTKLMNFGAFVQFADGIEGLVHISEISADRRINHPQDVLRAGQVVKAQVLAIDTEKRQIKLSMKQLIPTSIDEYIAEHKVGDKVSGRVVEQSANPHPRRAGRRHPRHLPHPTPSQSPAPEAANRSNARFQARPVQSLVHAQSSLARQRSSRPIETRASCAKARSALQNRQSWTRRQRRSKSNWPDTFAEPA